jgi:hypothetical protein
MPDNPAPYTVLLLYPDYIGNDDPCGFATFLGYGTGSPPEAVAQVRQQACDANNHDHDFADPTDFAVLAVFEGRHNDINPEG